LIQDIFISMLWSISPFGEAKTGIPYGIVIKGANKYIIFITCLFANILVYPLMLFFLDNVNKYLFRWNSYKRIAIFIARRAKKGSGNKIKKYGFLGLSLFVMIPLPGTGVYVGTLATYLFKMDRKKAFAANAIGIFFSSVIVWLFAVYSPELLSKYF